MTAQLFFVETPLTEKAADKAKREYQQRLDKEFKNAKELFEKKAFGTKDWYRLKFYMERANKGASFTQDGFKITIERI